MYRRANTCIEEHIYIKYYICKFLLFNDGIISDAEQMNGPCRIIRK